MEKLFYETIVLLVFDIKRDSSKTTIFDVDMYKRKKYPWEDKLTWLLSKYIFLEGNAEFKNDFF